MARQRFIWPDLWEDEDFGRLSLAGRQLFIALFSLADDEGRIAAHPANLRALAFRYDDMTLAEVQAIRDRVCATMRHVRLYEVDGHEYIALTSWEKRQHPKYPQDSRLPAPPVTVDQPTDGAPGGSGDSSPNVPPTFPQGDNDARETMGQDSSVGWVGLGRDGVGRDIPPAREPQSDHPATRPTGDPDFDAAWAAYPLHVDKGAAVACWKARVRSGHPPPALIAAASHYAEYIRARPDGVAFAKHMATFLGPKEPFVEWVDGIPEDMRHTLEAIAGGNRPRRRTSAYIASPTAPGTTAYDDLAIPGGYDDDEDMPTVRPDTAGAAP